MKSFSRTAPIEVSAADVLAPLPGEEHTMLTKEEQKRNMPKKSKQILDNKMFVAQCPHMMNQSTLRKQLPAVSLYVVPVLFESKVGTLANQLNFIYFSNISIISYSYLSNKFGIMSGTLFSLMDSGAVLSRYNDGTKCKGMYACKSRDFCHLGQSTISGGWMKILRLLTLLLPRL